MYTVSTGVHVSFHVYIANMLMICFSYQCSLLEIIKPYNFQLLQRKVSEFGLSIWFYPKKSLDKIFPPAIPIVIIRHICQRSFSSLTKFLHVCFLVVFCIFYLHLFMIMNFFFRGWKFAMATQVAMQNSGSYSISQFQSRMIR